MPVTNSGKISTGRLWSGMLCLLLPVFLLVYFGGPGTGYYRPAQQVIQPYTEGIRIGWDYNSLTRVHKGPVYYPRIIKLQSGDLLSAFESKGGILISRSVDNGKTWSNGTEVAPARNGIKRAVPELIELENKDILLAYNTRPPSDNEDPSKKFGIKVKRSRDQGHTWSSEIPVYEGGFEWNRGVWEPAMIQLSDGEIQLYFANEFPYEDSEDQEITMVRSMDKGRNWSPPQTISYRENFRDGMPVPLVLQNDQIAVAIEDNGYAGGEFKPAIIRSAAKESWNGKMVTGDSNRRWRALNERLRLPSSDYGGAPYLRQLDGGQTILSFQSTEGRPGPWSRSAMAVAIGDSNATNFTRKSEPFRVPDTGAALWNSLFVKSDSVITAVTSTDAFNTNGVKEYYIKDGRVMEELKPVQGTIRVDGTSDEKAYSLSPQYYIGAYSPANATISTAWDEGNFYLFFNVQDRSLVETEADDLVKGDGIGLMIAPEALPDDHIGKGTYKIIAAPSGDVQTYKGNDGKWKEYTADPVISVASDQNASEGYQMEMAIPWSLIGGLPSKTGWGINFELRNRNSQQALIRETISGNNEEIPSTWSKVQLKGSL